MGKEGKAYRFTGTALYDTWAIGTVSDGKIWPAIRVTSQNIPSPASRESPALGGWRNREEKLSPVTTLSPLWQTYSSGIVRDADLLTLNIGTPQGGNDLTDNPRFTSWSLWKRRKAETAAKNGSKEYRTAFPLARHEACRPAISQTGHQVSVSGHYRPREIQNSFYSIEISSFKHSSK